MWGGPEGATSLCAWAWDCCPSTHRPWDCRPHAGPQPSTPGPRKLSAPRPLAILKMHCASSDRKKTAAEGLESSPTSGGHHQSSSGTPAPSEDRHLSRRCSVPGGPLWAPGARARAEKASLRKTELSRATCSLDKEIRGKSPETARREHATAPSLPKGKTRPSKGEAKGKATGTGTAVPRTGGPSAKPRNSHPTLESQEAAAVLSVEVTHVCAIDC